MAILTRTRVFVLQNVNGIAFVLGAAWAYHGLARWSPAIAETAGGLVLMAIAATPYLRRARKP
jgi:hypothetical protein